MKHKWVALTLHELSEDRAREIASEVNPTDEWETERLMDDVPRGSTGPVCYACEQAWGLTDPECPGDPRDARLASMPIHL